MTDIAFREFGGTSAGPRVLITGGVHGDEFEPVVAIRRLIALFDHDAGLRRQIRGTLTLVPLVNEAAFRRGQRTAEDGLDLARVCPGREDGSVTERAAAALSEMIRAAGYYIDLHTGGIEYDVLPLAGYVLHPDREVLSVQRRMARAFNLPLVWGTAADLDGRSLSVARDALVPAIYCEYLGSGRCQEAGIAAYVEGCLNVMGELGMLDRALPACRVKRTVEDPRPGSGHLQIHNPSPISGLFEPCVSLGKTVRVGEPLGIVRDLTGVDEHVIRSECSGIVLTLRATPRVLEGQSVGMVLEDL